MAFVSILNDVLGPVMRGPSSSHTAGAYRVATLMRALCDGRPVRAAFTFDPGGSYAPTYAVCGVDLALACGLLGIEMTDARFFEALGIASSTGMDVTFHVAPLIQPEHPNAVEIELEDKQGCVWTARAASVGGGTILLHRINQWPLLLDEIWGHNTYSPVFSAEMLGGAFRQMGTGKRRTTDGPP